LNETEFLHVTSSSHRPTCRESGLKQIMYAVRDCSQTHHLFRMCTPVAAVQP
jgi:hypothetical protein